MFLVSGQDSMTESLSFLMSVHLGPLIIPLADLFWDLLRKQSDPGYLLGTCRRRGVY